MKHILWTLLIIVMICGSLTAQMTDARTLTIFIDDGITSGSLQASLESALVAEGFEITFTGDKDSADMVIELDQVDHLFIDLVMNGPFPPILPSAFLLPHIHTEFPLSGDPANPRMETLAVDIFVAMGAYLNGDCETATRYLQMALPSVDTVVVFAEQLIAYLNFYMGNCALISGDYATALQLYETNLAIYADNDFDSRYQLETAANLAWIYLTERQDSAAAFALLDIPPVLHAEHLWLPFAGMKAYLHALQGDRQQAFDTIDQMINCLVDLPMPYVYSGRIHAVFGEWDSALEDFDWVEKNFKDYTDVYFYRGAVLYEMGEYADALYDLEEYLAQSPHGALALAAQTYIDAMIGN